jgi:hypothetical protein
MKLNFLFLLTFIVQVGVAQTDKHVKINGTKCSMVPPNGFSVATSFSGFQNLSTGASIMINELPAPYLTLVNGFTKEALKLRQMTLISKEKIVFNYADATFFNVSQPANGITYLKQMLVFGDASKTVLVNGIYPDSLKNSEAIIKESLLSTIYDDSQNDNPLDAATFTIETLGTDFKVVKYFSGSLLYSTDGKIPTEKPTLIVGNSLSKISLENQKEYSTERLKKLPGGDKIIIKQTLDIAVDDLNGYEIIAEGKTKDNKPELVYQVMLFNDEGDYFIILGQTKEEFPKYLEEFKKVTKTFKRK